MRKQHLRSYQQPAASYVPVHGLRRTEPRGESVIGTAMAFADDGEESFADLFEASLKSPKKAIARRDPEVGEVVSGEVVQIGTEYAFLDIGAKAEAMISLDELRDEQGDLTIQLGDKLEGHVVSVGGKEGGVMISGKLQRGAGLRDQLRLAYEQGIPVEGLVTGVNKGGLDIDLGGVRAFLPVSQIELRYCQDPSSYVGRAMTLRVTRYDEDGRNVVVSRRSILEIEQRAMAERTREKLVPGGVFNGIVTSVKDYGAFVDIGGIEGLVHISELAYGRGQKADEVVKPGQRVEVVVLKIDVEAVGATAEAPKISLSLKALMADPMDELLKVLTEGEQRTGKVVRLENFGAFVELSPGVEGLIHISAMSDKHVGHPREVVALGQEVTATVISVDAERRRIGLSLIEEMRQAQAQAASALSVGAVVTVLVDHIEPHGVIVKVSTAAGAQPKGTIPNPELAVPRGSDLKRLFPEGKELRAVVQAIESDGRVRLSIKALEVVEERASVAAYSGVAAQTAGKATMGEMLRSKLGLAVPVAPESAAEEEKAVEELPVAKPRARRAPAKAKVAEAVTTEEAKIPPKAKAGATKAAKAAAVVPAAAGEESKPAKPVDEAKAAKAVEAKAAKVLKDEGKAAAKAVKDEAVKDEAAKVVKDEAKPKKKAAKA